ncbi:MAG TPA: hypothetical protein ENN80_01010 [Candidatus Hydrogenedentes bacterium]|nr:hypothetical protein [Candidatus Hydrogenedentota bacterium]
MQRITDADLILVAVACSGALGVISPAQFGLDGPQQRRLVVGVHAEFPNHNARQTLVEGVARFPSDGVGIVEVEPACFVLIGLGDKLTQDVGLNGCAVVKG